MIGSIERVSHVHVSDVFLESGDEGLDDWSLDDDAFCGHADLAGVEEATPDEGTGCVFDVGVLEDLNLNMSFNEWGER